MPYALIFEILAYLATIAFVVYLIITFKPNTFQIGGEDSTADDPPSEDPSDDPSSDDPPSSLLYLNCSNPKSSKYRKDKSTLCYQTFCNTIEKINQNQSFCKDVLAANHLKAIGYQISQQDKSKKSKKSKKSTNIKDTFKTLGSNIKKTFSKKHK